jgi:hypothetical protein
MKKGSRCTPICPLFSMSGLSQEFAGNQIFICPLEKTVSILAKHLQQKQHSLIFSRTTINK